AAPTASATPSSSWSGTTPLMSYALTMLARSPNAGPALSLATSAAPRCASGIDEPIGPAAARTAAPAGDLGGRPRPPGPRAPSQPGLSAATPSPRSRAPPGHRRGPGPVPPAAAPRPSHAVP